MNLRVALSFVLLGLVIVGTVLTLSRSSSNQIARLQTKFIEKNTDTLDLSQIGWDDTAWKIYHEKMKEMIALSHGSAASGAVRTLRILPTLAELRVIKSRNYGGWWSGIDGQFSWEKQTFITYFQYIDSSTTLIDFGTWIGPTLMYGAQFAKAAYGLECDPAAFVEMQTNIKLNSHLYFAQKIQLLPFCVGLEDRIVEMHSAISGNSCSGLGRVACGNVSTTWKVRVIPLPALFRHWGLEPKSNVFIKIDVESFECKLVPSFLTWLSPLGFNKPTLYISMHKGVDPCSEEEYLAFTKLQAIYRFSMCNSQTITAAPQQPFPCQSGELLLSDLYPPV